VTVVFVAVDRRDPALQRLAEAAAAEDRARDDLRAAHRRVTDALRELQAAGTSSRRAARAVLRALGSPLDRVLVEREAARLRKMTRPRNSSHQDLRPTPGDRAPASADSVKESGMDHRILKRRTVTEEWVEQPLDFDPDASGDGDDDYESNNEFDDVSDGPAEEFSKPTSHQPRPARLGRR
jgi:hypothetical protein